MTSAKFITIAFWLCAVGCTEAQDSRRVVVPIVVDSSLLQPTPNDLGYTVHLDTAKIVIKNLVFTVGGETHVAHLGKPPGHFVNRCWSRFKSVVEIPEANAHPGHYQGGEITGELIGRFILDWFTPESMKLGDATLFEGDYLAANLTLDYGSIEDGLDPDDPLVGVTAVLTGSAKKDDKSIPFVVVVVAPENRSITGIPCDATISVGASQRLLLRVSIEDPLENDTLFDGVDFGLLWTDTSQPLRLADDSGTQATKDAFFAIRNALLSHDHFSFYVETLQ